MAWTDERLDDLADRMDAGFARVDLEIRALRGEIGGLRTELRGEIDGLRTELRVEIGELRSEVRGDIGSLRGDIESLRTLMIRFCGGTLVCLLGVIATAAVNGL